MVDFPEQPSRAADDFNRVMGASVYGGVEALVRAAEAEGQPLSELEETDLMRSMRRMAAVMGGVGALIAGRYEGPAGLHIFAKMCAGYIAADPDLLAALPRCIENADAPSRPILEDLLKLAREVQESGG